MSFRELVVWQKAYELCLQIYRITGAFPKSENFALGLQLRKASASVPANIAEGSERTHKKEFLQFLAIARGSLSEVETFLLLAKDLRYIDNKNYESLNNLRGEVGKLLRGLTKSLS
jgi:four helix bundle protein